MIDFVNKTAALDLMENRVGKNPIVMLGNRTIEDIHEIEKELGPYGDYIGN